LLPRVTNWEKFVTREIRALAHTHRGGGGYPWLRIRRNGEHNAKLPREGSNKMFWASFTNRSSTLTLFGHPPQRL